MADPDTPYTADVERLLAAVPTDAETALRAVERYRRRTFEEPWAEFAAVQRDMDILLDGREPSRAEPGHPFWMHWKDPFLGRRR